MFDVELELKIDFLSRMIEIWLVTNIWPSKKAMKDDTSNDGEEEELTNAQLFLIITVTW